MKAFEGYWHLGLHDAIITEIKHGALSPNYKEKNYRYNYLTFWIDASDATYDREVKEITFCNFSAASATRGKRIEDYSRFIGAYWMGDTLREKNGKYTLDLTLRCKKKGGGFINESIVLEFQQVEVKR